VDVATEPGAFTEFTITLPRQSVTTTAPAAPPQPATETESQP